MPHVLSPRLHRVGWAVIFAVALSALALSRPQPMVAQTQTTCPAATPYDQEPDDAAITACLEEFDRVLLAPAEGPDYVGYVVTATIEMRRNGSLLTSSRSPKKATLIAAPSLSVPMFRARANNFEISFISFDGNRDARDDRNRPCNINRNYRNVELTGTGFKVRYTESTRAVCASGMTVGGSANFEISNSRFYDNGRQPEDAAGIGGLWADGLNVFNCTGGTVRDNVFWDNTDVDLGVNGGPGCGVYRNTIEHFNRYAFAGLVAGDPSRIGGEFSENQVESAPNMLGFGIVVGCHPWPECVSGYATNLWVHDNSVRGAVVNFVVDGLNGGAVERNRIGPVQGTRVLNCLQPAEYLVAHVINVRLQSGFRVQPVDYAGECS